MNLQELLSQEVGSVIELKDGTRLLIDENDHYEGDRLCFGLASNRRCYFLKDKEGNWRKQHCPGSKGYCEHCYIELKEGETKPEVYRPNGVDAIAAERQRQMFKENWTLQHDDEHIDRELAKAAICYLLAHINGNTKKNCPNLWPWDIQYWKPEEKTNSIKNLKRAGALIAAEIDRINRLNAAEADYFETEE